MTPLERGVSPLPIRRADLRMRRVIIVADSRRQDDGRTTV